MKKSQKIEMLQASRDSKVTDLVNPKIARASKEKAQKRYDICSDCELFDKAFGRCTSCGCFMKLKTTLEISKCPKGKW